MTYTAGDQLSYVLYVVDPSGNALTGLAPAAVDGTGPAGPHGFHVSEEGDGQYLVVSNPTDHAGIYTVRVVMGDPWDQQFVLTFDVEEAGDAAYPVQITPAKGLTRRQLRRMIARDLGDFYEWVATHRGTTSSIIDRVRFARQLHHFRGMEVTVLQGAKYNIGQSRTVTGSDPESQSITFAPEMGAEIAVGDSGELHNYRGNGWTFHEKNEAINAAIDRAGELQAVVSMSVDIPEPFDRKNPYIDIPEPMSHLAGVQYTDRRGMIRRVPYKDFRATAGMASVEVRGCSASDMNGRSVRLYGFARPGRLLSDGQRTSVPAEWLVAEAKAVLQEGAISSSLSPGGRERMFNASRTGADARRGLTLVRFPPNTVRVR